ncbi:ETS homologous factor-like [Cimex lectularius]|uniref:ETS domain-containing protein n=1 Tax=Cimex lectularius TaxID=79782 RepID=A0A8I6S667_CIMLE|nr:ETS homologous factor-like [Cimex lectularius]
MRMPFQDHTINNGFNFNLFPHNGEDEFISNYYPSTNLGSAMTFSLDNPYPENNCLISTNPLLSDSVEPTDNRQDLNNKQDDLPSDSVDGWRTKPVKLWDKRDIVEWLNSEARQLNICCTEICSEKFASFDGNKFFHLTSHEFNQCDMNYGLTLYKRLQEIKLTQDETLPLNFEQSSESIKHENREIEEPENAPVLMCLDKTEPPKINYSCNTSKQNDTALDAKISDPDSPAPQQPKQKMRGRPKGQTKRKKKPEKLGRLWEFLRDLLKNRDYCPSLIVWDNYEEGMFRFVQSDKVAKLWGTKKDNPDMNYEKLSRAMRYYYKSQVLQPVIGRRLVYKFGPTATGWQVDNPNFKNK